MTGSAERESTVRCRSCVWSRRSCTVNRTSPRSIALPINDSRSGARYSGKIDTTSIRIEQPLHLDDLHAAGGEVHDGHDVGDERDEDLPTWRVDREHVVARQV